MTRSRLTALLFIFGCGGVMLAYAVTGPGGGG